MKSQKSTLLKTVDRKWFEIDVSKMPMGRAATTIANLLRGKGKRIFTPHIDLGDFVVAINCDRLKFTGRKVAQKKYFRHSGYLGGLKTSTLKTELDRHPEQVLKRAVYSMLDEVKFRKAMIARLKLFKKDAHSLKIDKKLT